MRFVEIEHKFVVGAAFRRQRFEAAVLALGPERRGVVDAEDTYFVTGLSRRLIFRHRFDRERQELTVKGWTDESEARLEVNLQLDPGSGNQRMIVSEFLRPFDVRFQGTIKKRIRVFYFPDCEIVHYAARAGDRRVSCVEFEALGAPDLPAARRILRRYEERTGFAGEKREPRSLFDLLLRPRMIGAEASPDERR